MRVSILKKDGVATIQFEADVVEQDSDGTHFYHYHEFYLKLDGKPFRSIRTDDFFMVISGRV